MNTKKIGQLILVGAVVFGVFGWWAYQSYGSSTFGLTLKSDKDLINGEVLHWTFDGSGMTSNIADVSGNNNFGTTSTATTTVAGAVGQGINVLNQVIDGGNNASMQLGSTLTASFWIKGPSSPPLSYVTIIGKVNYGTTAWGIVNDTGANANRLYVRVDTSGGLNQTPCFNVPALDNHWHHVVFELNNGACTAYMDGVPSGINGSYVVGGGFSAPNTDFYVQGSSDPFLLDDVRIYNRVLSQREISRLYGLGGGASSTVMGATLRTNEGINGNGGSGEVAHFTFDGKDMLSNVADVSGSGNNGILQGFTSTTSIQGRIGQALLFNGTTNYVDAGNASSVQLSTGSVSAWIKTTNAGNSYRAIITKQFAYGLFLLDNVLDIFDWGGGSVDRSTGLNLADGKWHHVAESFQSGVANGTLVYVDGSPVMKTSMTVTNQTRNLLVGYGDSGGQNFTGSIDDARTYNRVLSPQEVSRLYGLGATAKDVTITTNQKNTSGEVGHWTFDGKDITTTFNDVTGRGNNATSTAFTSTTTIQGRVGQALSFSTASSQYLSVGSQTDFNFERTNTFSIAAWIRRYNTTNRDAIFGKEGSNCGPGYHMEVEDASGSGAVSGNTLQLWLYNGVNHIIASTIATITAGKWNHVAATYNGTGVLAGVRLYINGVLMPIDSNSFDTLGANTILNTSPPTIGADCGGQGGWVNGLLDDVRVYNRVLSPQDVSRLYGLGQ